jgi:hypothetical protein
MVADRSGTTKATLVALLYLQRDNDAFVALKGQPGKVDSRVAGDGCP